MTTDMFAIANAELANLNEKIERLPAPQVIVLLTDSDRFYVAVNDVDGTVCETMKREKDTKVVRILAMWKDGSIDLPSFDFRKALIQINGINGIHIRTLETTLPPVQK